MVIAIHTPSARRGVKITRFCKAGFIKTWIQEEFIYYQVINEASIKYWQILTVLGCHPR